MSSPERLILFDVDGTLLSTGGRAGGALVQAIGEVIGRCGPLTGYRYSGKTDPQIVFELTAGAGVPRAEVAEALPRICARYLELLHDALPPGAATVLSGVRETLEILDADSKVAVGLLTGNLAAGAAAKLAAAGLDGYFPFGAFGSDNEDRNCLVPVARARAAAHLGSDVPATSTVVVGDAEADILCARAGGVRVVAVASGWTDRATLAALEPDALFDSMVDPGFLPALLDGAR